MISQTPAFFAQAPRIQLYDPLAQFLGASVDGLITYEFADVVALAGHSCPTVASAYLMTRAALKALYGEDIPVRGNLAVAWQDERDEGVIGVMANVVSMLTGAADDSGFKGIGGYFQRSERLHFGEPIAAEVRFTRLDTGKSVLVSTDLSSIPMAAQARALLPLCIQGQATMAQRLEFGALWQERVRAILLEHADDPEVIRLSAA